jgi:hypothetical protein
MLFSNISSFQKRCKPNLRGYSMRYLLSGGKRVERKKPKLLNGKKLSKSR